MPSHCFIRFCCIVLLAITLDRITQGMGQPRRGVRHWWQSGPAGLIAQLFQR